MSCLIVASTNANSHDASNLDELIIARTNDTVAEHVLSLQLLLTDLMKGAGDNRWPRRDLDVLLRELKHLQEDVALSMEYYTNRGVNLGDEMTLRANPTAGSAVLAHRAVETSLALLEHVSSIGNRDEFVREIYDRGPSYYMYDALTAYRDGLSLYLSIIECRSGEDPN